MDAGTVRFATADDVPAALRAAPVELLLGRDCEVEECRVRMLQASRSRPVAEYEIVYREPDGRRALLRVVGKANYRRDAARAFACMATLWAEGFGGDARLTIPRPLAFLPERQLALQGYVGGACLYELIDEPASGLPYLGPVGRWLGKLHAVAPFGELLDPDAERFKIDVFREGLLRAAPHEAGRLTDVADATVEALRRLVPYLPVVSHGDFQPKNIFVDGDRIAVIDFDRCVLAHPARDLGHFVAQSLTMSYVRTQTFARIAPWNQRFLQEYARVGKPEALRAMPAYLAYSLLEILYYKLCVRPVKDPGFLPAWLDECESWLADGGTVGVAAAEELGPVAEAG